MYRILILIAFIGHLCVGISIFSVETIAQNPSMLPSKFEAYRQIKAAADTTTEPEVEPGDSRKESATTNS